MRPPHALRPALRLLACLGACLAIVACSDDDTPTNPAPSDEVGIDASGGPDASDDVGLLDTEAFNDAEDLGSDAQDDVAPEDAVDDAEDLGADAADDTSQDTTTDAVEDAVEDAAEDAATDTTTGDVVQDVPPIDPRLDSDEDGVPDVVEIEGHTIFVDRFGDPGNPEAITVDSDPMDPDTDDDGLTDGQEWNLLTHPRSDDSDGDGLTDAAELQRWRTSPLTVDTDGDAGWRYGQVIADVDFFDGAELQLVEQGGREVPGPNATSPLLADTDGDGADDPDEDADAFRSPLHAELPALDVTLLSNSEIRIGLNQLLRSDQTTTRQVEDTITVMDSWERAEYSETNYKLSIFGSALFGYGASVTVGVGLKTLGGGGGVDLRQKFVLGFDTNYTRSWGVDLTQGRQLSQRRRQWESSAASQGYSIESGYVLVPLTVRNTTNRSVVVQNLSMALSYFDKITGTVKPLTTVTPTVDSSISLGPDASTTVFARADDIPAPRALSLLSNPETILLQPANYDLVDGQNVDFDFRFDDVLESTASVLVDDGHGNLRQFTRTPTLDRDEEGELVPIGLDELLRREGYDVETLALTNAEGDAEIAWSIDGRAAALHTEPAPDLADPFPYILSEPPGPRWLASTWLAVVQGVDEDPDYIDDLTTPILPGQAVQLIHAVDGDRDGIVAAEEDARGTSDDDLDTDDDGLSDFYETREGWTIYVFARSAYRAYPSPIQADADLDGLDDLEERTHGTDPNLSDTDGDGTNDFDEATDETRDPLRFDSDIEGPEPPLLSCQVREAREFGISAGYYTIRICAGHPSFEVNNLSVHFPGGTPSDPGFQAWELGEQGSAGLPNSLLVERCLLWGQAPTEVSAHTVLGGMAVVACTTTEEPFEPCAGDLLGDRIPADPDEPPLVIENTPLCEE